MANLCLWDEAKILRNNLLPIFTHSTVKLIYALNNLISDRFSFKLFVFKLS